MSVQHLPLLPNKDNITTLKELYKYLEQGYIIRRRKNNSRICYIFDYKGMYKLVPEGFLELLIKKHYVKEHIRDIGNEDKIHNKKIDYMYIYNNNVDISEIWCGLKAIDTLKNEFNNKSSLNVSIIVDNTSFIRIIGKLNNLGDQFIITQDDSYISFKSDDILYIKRVVNENIEYIIFLKEV